MWRLVGVLALGFVGLLAYAAPTIRESLRPDGELTLGILAGLALLIVQLIATKLIIESSLDSARVAARKAAKKILEDDAHNIIELYRNIQSEYSGEPTSTVRKFLKPKQTLVMGIDPITLKSFESALKAQSINAQLQFLAAHLAPDQVPKISYYLADRAGLANSFERAMAEGRIDAFMSALFSRENSLPAREADAMTHLEAGWFLGELGHLLETVKELGLEIKDPSAVKAQMDFSLQRLSKHFAEDEQAA